MHRLNEATERINVARRLMELNNLPGLGHVMREFIIDEFVGSLLIAFSVLASLWIHPAFFATACAGLLTMVFAVWKWFAEKWWMDEREALFVEHFRAVIHALRSPEEIVRQSIRVEHATPVQHGTQIEYRDYDNPPSEQFVRLCWQIMQQHPRHFVPERDILSHAEFVKDGNVWLDVLTKEGILELVPWGQNGARAWIDGMSLQDALARFGYAADTTPLLRVPAANSHADA